MNKKSVTSLQNSTMKLVRELQKKKSTRKKNGLFVVEGIRAVREIPKQTNIKYLITTPDVNEEELGHILCQEWLEVSVEVYKTLSETQSPQGAMAIVEMPKVDLEQLDVTEGNYLLLENLQDPGNLGTIIRTAHAFDFKAIFLTKGSVDLYSPKVVRSTMSSLFHIPIIIDYEVEEYVAYFKQHQVTLYTTALVEGAKPIYEIDYEPKKVIVIGNEGNGVSDYIKQRTDYTMIIPMPGAAESLNASVATSICMYEVTRPR